MEYEDKWALGGITVNKTSGNDGIPAELFQILKDGAVKVLYSNLENSAMATGLEKVSFHSNLTEGQCQRMFKLLHNCTHLTCYQGNAQNPSSYASTVHEPRISRYTSWNLEKAVESEIKLPTSTGS